ncbi:MAG: HEPN family nuclease [Phycisphaerales bacterium JB050]
MEYQDLVRDFARRTKHNLKVIRNHQKCGGEAHEVTQLINSMLGMLVLPKEHYYKRIPTTSLDELRTDGWPETVLSGEFEAPKHLRDLVRLLRNSIAHFNIEFITSQNKICGVILANKCNCGRVTWRAELSLNDLEKITRKFVELILENEPA